MMEKKSIQDGLKSLIEQTYLIEKEYKTLNQSYLALQNFTQDIVDSLGAGLWVVKNGKIDLRNKKACGLDEILKFVDFDKNNQEVEFQGSFYAIKITKKEENYIILATDISDEKRNERLVSMGAVAAHLSHEIRNPIGSISLLASTLLKRVDERNLAIVEQMQKAIFRVERIIKATLLFTKGVSPNLQSLNLANLENSCKNAILLYTFSKDIKFEFENFKNQITCDFDLIEMVFSNLIFNAIDAIEESDDESGEVRLKYELLGDEHTFYISDSGVKLPESMIFEPFKTTKLKGNGLGLALSLQIIMAHGGTIALQKEPKLFTITLPAKI